MRELQHQTSPKTHSRRVETAIGPIRIADYDPTWQIRCGRVHSSVKSTESGLLLYARCKRELAQRN